MASCGDVLTEIFQPSLQYLWSLFKKVVT